MYRKGLFMQGTVKFFKEKEGFGFIGFIEGRSQDLFVHWSAIKSEGGFKKLLAGQVVEFDIVTVDGKERAANVTVLKNAEFKR